MPAIISRLQYPSRLRRIASMIYDLILLFGVVFLANYLFDALTQSRDPSGLQLRHWRQLWMFIVIGIYFISAWRLGGQTLAMKSWGIKVTTINGERLSLGMCLLRYVLAWPMTLTGIGLIWSFFDPERQFLHDRLLKTRLISVGAPKW